MLVWGEVWLFAIIKTRFRVKTNPVERVLWRIFTTRGIDFEVTDTFGVRTLECTVVINANDSYKRALARCDNALRLIAANGIRTVVTAEDFPISELGDIYGLSPPDIRKLWRRTAGKIALFISGSSRNPLSVALHANRISSDLDGAVRYLLPRTRHLAVFCAAQGDAYARRLLKEFGIAVQTTGNAALTADVHLFFDPPPEHLELKDSAVAVNLFPGSHEVLWPYRTVSKIQFRWPDGLPKMEGFSGSMLLAALSESGLVSYDKLDIENVWFSDGGA
ncbi:MAG: hypothetical protein GX193_07255 [Clostridiales bacterium]|nr:hypothetical protein [Clostridiales bacterium]